MCFLDGTRGRELPSSAAWRRRGSVSSPSRRAHSSAGERPLHTREVPGSIPGAPISYRLAEREPRGLSRMAGEVGSGPSVARKSPDSPGRWLDKVARTNHHREVETRVHDDARRRSAMGRALLVGAILAAALGLAAESQAAVKASVKNGTLKVSGTSAGERIALRRAPGGRLVVDVRDNGSADFSFLRNRFARIVVNGGSGNDRLRIDEGNGAFTDTEKTTLNGASGLDTLIGGRFAETLNAGGGNDTVDANA